MKVILHSIFDHEIEIFLLITFSSKFILALPGFEIFSDMQGKYNNIILSEAHLSVVTVTLSGLRLFEELRGEGGRELQLDTAGQDPGG